MASDKQAADILLLDIRKVTSFADYFVIMSGESRRQMEALAEDLAHELKEAGATLHHKEGTPSSGWILMDFGDVILHLFATETREFFQLEQLWAKARPVIRVQ